jgi:hypothetical protein
VATAGVLAALCVVATAAGAVPAGAGVVPVPGEFSCSYSVTPTTLPPGGGTVTVSGVAPGSSIVRVFLDGELAATAPAAPVTGEFSVDVFITASVEISVALDDYPSTPCIGVGGANTNIDVTGSAGRRRLPFTGSSDTVPVALLGASAVCLGLVLVVASRRRTGVQGRV